MTTTDPTTGPAPGPAPGPATEAPDEAARPASRPAATAASSVAAAPPVPAGAPVPSGDRGLFPPVLAAGALVCLIPVTATTDTSSLGGFGLAAVLPGWAWAAVCLAGLACAAELLRRRPSGPLLTALTAVLIVCTTGLPSVAERGARIPTAWLHSGFVDAIAVRGQLPVDVDARFGWAGFFSQWAWILDAGGGGSLDGVLRWAPPVIVAVWAVGVFALARPFLGPGRAPWVAVWLFCGVNWIEQDYFSPQATAMIMALAVLALVLGPLATPPDEPRRRPPGPPAAVLVPWAAVALCLLALCVAHQLTPIALGAQLAVLALRRRFWGRWLVLLLLAAEVTWVVLGAHDVWVEQWADLVGGVGDVGGSVSSSLFDRLVGDGGQLVVKVGRVLLTAATWVLALQGARVWRRRERRVPLLLLAGVPAVLVVGQSYGGEVLLRVLLYGLPFLAVLGTEALRAAAASARGRWPRAGRPGVAVAATAGLVALCATTVVLRGGNDAYLTVSPSEATLTRSVLASVPRGGTVLPLTNAGPMELARVDVTQVTTAPGCDELADDLPRCLDEEQPEAVLVLPSMDATGSILEGRPAGWSRDAVATMARQGYRVTYADLGASPGDVTAVLVRGDQP